MVITARRITSVDRVVLFLTKIYRSWRAPEAYFTEASRLFYFVFRLFAKTGTSTPAFYFQKGEKMPWMHNPYKTALAHFNGACGSILIIYGSLLFEELKCAESLEDDSRGATYLTLVFIWKPNHKILDALF